jgi:regulator of sigma E protease
MNHQLIMLAMSAGWIKFFQFFIALSILILIHEWGHYYAARKTGTRVEKFYLFFDFLFPISTLLPFSLWKKKIGDTEYGLGWFPMGGYVKIAGMVDESMDKDALALPPKPDEFRSKTAPQRLLIMLGGIIMNVLLAIVVYTFVFAYYGEELVPNKGLKYGIACDSLGKAAGFVDGDLILKINGEEEKYYDNFLKDFIFKPAKNVTVLRNNQEVTFNIPEGVIGSIVNNKQAFVSPRIPFVIDTISLVKNAKFLQNEVKKGDKILFFNESPTTYFHDYANAIKNFATVNKSATGLPPATITLLRNTDTVKVLAQLDTNGKLGIVPEMDYKKFASTETFKYNAISAIPKALSYTWEKVGDYGSNLKALFANKEIKASESLGGFASFTKIFPSKFDMESFLRLLAFISIMLAFMNLLPIPGLDGGYVFFLLIEMITGKKVSESIMEKATTVGLMLLLGLMLYANGLDIWRALR